MTGGAAVVVPAVRAELARKALHLASAALPIALSVGAISLPALRVLLAVATLVALSVEIARHTMPAVQRRFVAGVGSMLRPHEHGAITGATWLAVALLGAALLLPAHPAIVAMWAAAMGDGLASLVGRLASKRVSRDAGQKTWAGSVTCLVVTAAGAWWLVAAPIGAALLVGAAAAAAERPRIALDDNLRVAAAAGLAAWALLPA